MLPVVPSHWKEEEMLRKYLSPRLMLLLMALAAVAILVADSPWGPD